VTRVVLVLVALLAVAWLVFLRPTALGGSTSYVVVSGSSMDPTLRDGDLVVVRERDSYDIGDVIAFRLPEGQPGPEGDVIHRIVAGSPAEGFVTRGDNRDADDAWRVFPEDVRGEQVARLPKVGAIASWLARPLVLGLMVGAALASLYWIVRIQRGHDARPAPVTVRPATASETADPGGPEVLAARIRERFERADPEMRKKIRQVVFDQAAAYQKEDPTFDIAAFLRACGAYAYD
jgi:signal peptidase